MPQKRKKSKAAPKKLTEKQHGREGPHKDLHTMVLEAEGAIVLKGNKNQK
jgi:hypothetical protein